MKSRRAAFIVNQTARHGCIIKCAAIHGYRSHIVNKRSTESTVGSLLFAARRMHLEGARIARTIGSKALLLINVSIVLRAAFIDRRSARDTTRSSNRYDSRRGNLAGEKHSRTGSGRSPRDKSRWERCPGCIRTIQPFGGCSLKRPVRVSSQCAANAIYTYGAPR